jgi:hypothetical protein
LPPIISELDGNLLGPAEPEVGEEEADVEVQMLRYDLSCFATFLLSMFTLDVVKDVDKVQGVDIHDVDIVLEVGIVHDVLGGWADLLVEDRVPEPVPRHLPTGEDALADDFVVDCFAGVGASP